MNELGALEDINFSIQDLRTAIVGESSYRDKLIGDLVVALVGDDYDLNWVAGEGIKKAIKIADATLKASKEVPNE